MKKFRVALFALALALTELSYAQAKIPRSRSGAASPDIVKAERAWRSFYPKFLRAVKRHDRSSLSQMMVPEFCYSFGGGSDRDEAFGYWDEPYVRGWSKLERVLAAGVSKPGWSTAVSDGEEAISKPDCFVLMPISDPEGYDKGHFKRVYEDIFAPACDRAGFKAIRADEVRQANLIHLDILQKLIHSPMALCDLSSRNPNALFELGLRQAFDKPVVLVQEVGTPAIFDIAPLRYVEYHRDLRYRDVLEDQKNIAEAIQATQEAFQSGQGVNSIVRLLSLTHPASLTSISEAEKEPVLLELIMEELGSLRSEIRKVARSHPETRLSAITAQAR